MAKKNMGKVKHYRHSFYHGSRKASRILGPLVVVLLLFLLGWIVGPRLVNWASGAWQTAQENASNSAAASQAQAQSEVTQPAAEAEPTPEPTPQPTGAEITEGAWSYVNLGDMRTNESAQAVVDGLAAQGVKYAVVTLKDANGLLYYPSGVELAQNSISQDAVDAGALAQMFKNAGITPVAQLSVMQDSSVPYTDRTLAIHYQTSDYFWLDANQNAGGRPWLNPYAEGVANYISALIAELRQLGYDQVLLTTLQFPATDSENLGFGETGGVERTQQLANLISRWQDEVVTNGGALWVEYPLAYASAADGINALGGGNLAALGVANMVIELPNEVTDQTDAQLQTAKDLAKQGGAAHIVVRSGDAAQFN